MRPKSVLILFLIVAALVAFIWFYERELPSSDERSELAKRALRLERGDVERIELEREGRRVSLVRVPNEPTDEEGDESLGFLEEEWQLEEPDAGRADIDLVDGLLEALESLENLRQLEGMEASKAGLDSPRATLVLHTGSGTTELQVGAEVPASETMIVRVDGGEPQVVSTSLWDSLSPEPGDWRSKDLYFGDRDAIDSVVLETDGARVRLARRDDSFWIEEPLVDRADPDKVRGLLGAIVGLRVHSFLDDPEGSRADLGFEPPAATFQVASTDREQEFHLDWGRPVPEEATRSFARVEGQVFETSAPLAEYLESSPEAWRSKHLTTLQTHEIDSVRVLDGEGELTLRRAGADWERNGDRISFTAVSDLLYSLVEAEASGFADPEGFGGPELDSTEPELHVTLSDGQRDESVRFGRTGAGQVAASPSERESILVLDEAVLGGIREKLAAVRAAAPLGAESSASTTENLENSDDESQ